MNNFTIVAISDFTDRKCIRFTEMAFVLVAVFDSGRPTFISKKKLYERVVRQECLDGEKLQQEWSIGLTYKPVVREVSTEAITKVIAYRLRRARFEYVAEYGHSVTGRLPKDSIDREIAFQIAKDSGWAIIGDRVEVSV